jgi:glycerophosphoryl diester phosphodiesterase
MLCIDDLRMKLPLIIGHRGASAVAPENTIVAFERALTAGADGLEFDVRLARDGVPVVIHDADLRRTGLTQAKVRELSSAELAGMNVGRWFNRKNPAVANPDYESATVPLLRSVFEFVQNNTSILYVELKCEAVERQHLAHAVVQLLHEYRLRHRVVVEGFDLESIAEVKRQDPEVRTAALFEPKLSRPLLSTRNVIREAAAVGAEEIALHHSLVTKGRTAAIRQGGMEAVVWTVDKPVWVDRASRYGLRAVITNDPARLLAYRV